MKKLDGIIVTPNMQFHEVAAQIMGKQTCDFLLKRELTVKTGKKLGYSDEAIENGIECMLSDIKDMFDQSKSRITCDFEVINEKAPTEAATSDVDAHNK